MSYEFLDRLRQALAASGIPASALKINVTLDLSQVISQEADIALSVAGPDVESPAKHAKSPHEDGNGKAHKRQGLKRPADPEDLLKDGSHYIAGLRSWGTPGNKVDYLKICPHGKTHGPAYRVGPSKRAGVPWVSETRVKELMIKYGKGARVQFNTATVAARPVDKEIVKLETYKATATTTEGLVRRALESTKGSNALLLTLVCDDCSLASQGATQKVEMQICQVRNYRFKEKEIGDAISKHYVKTGHVNYSTREA